MSRALQEKFALLQNPKFVRDQERHRRHPNRKIDPVRLYASVNAPVDDLFEFRPQNTARLWIESGIQ
jgi:hypothetical protein